MECNDIVGESTLCVCETFGDPSIPNRQFLQRPLAVCDSRSVPEKDHFPYELHFPDRIGEDYPLRFDDQHKWYVYSRMTADECSVFKVFDTHHSDTRFVFHTAVDDPRGGFKAPTRRSVEVLTITVW